jgi:hypothetical protein
MVLCGFTEALNRVRMLIPDSEEIDQSWLVIYTECRSGKKRKTRRSQRTLMVTTKEKMLSLAIFLMREKARDDLSTVTRDM